jgi:hypothetical protein
MSVLLHGIDKSKDLKKKLDFSRLFGNNQLIYNKLFQR